MDKLKRKLRSRAGESLAEVLVSTLIAVLALMILAGLISSTNKMVVRSKKLTEDYVTAANLMAEQSSSGATAELTFYVDGTAGETAVKLTDGSEDDKKIDVTCYTNSTIGGIPVTAYKKGS